MEFVTPWVAWHVVMLFLQVIIGAWCGVIVTQHIEAHGVELGILVVAVVLGEGN